MSVRKQPIPEIFVLWHPEFKFGEFLGRSVHRWLRPEGGGGPQVFFRSLPSPEMPAARLPLPLPGERRAGLSSVGMGCRASNLQVILVLIEENMVADASWRHWLELLGAGKVGLPKGVAREFVPVAMDSTAFNVPGRLRELNFLRPSGIPVPADTRTTDPAGRVVEQSLLKQLTEAFCRLYFGRRRPGRSSGMERDGMPPKIRIFLSHAKEDGTVPAKRLRDYIYSQTQMAAFYDENDIPTSSTFARVLDHALREEETAALVAVRSARYASRPWCRREIALFRRPRLEAPEKGRQSQHWRLSPTLVVEAMDGGKHTWGIPELGNAPVIGWESGETAGHEERVVTTLLRDVLLAAYHRAVGCTITDRPGQVILNWAPDPITLLGIPELRSREGRTVFFPGRGLSGMELGLLEDYFPGVRFRSFEEEVS